MTNDLYCSTDGCGDFENNVSKILSDISQLQNKDIDQDARLEALELLDISAVITVSNNALLVANAIDAKATLALSTASTADGKATGAVSDAANSVLTAGDALTDSATALNKAIEAYNAASGAVSVAGYADAKAVSALSASGTAVSDAAAAVITANAADGKADIAVYDSNVAVVKVNKAIITDAQTLTTGQKTQARENINAVGLIGNETIAGDKTFTGNIRGRGNDYRLYELRNAIPVLTDSLAIMTKVIRSAEYLNSDIVNYTYSSYCIGANAFQFASALKSVNFNDTVIIMSLAFNGCVELKQNVFFKGSMLYPRAFANSGILSCDILYNVPIQIDCFKNCPNFTMLILRDMTLCELKDINALILTPIADGSGYVYVPDALLAQYIIATNWSVYASQIFGLSALTDVPEGMFENNLLLTSYPYKPTKLGKSAFVRCTNLKSIDLSECTYIGSFGFANCTSMKGEITMPITVIGYQGMRNGRFTSITITEQCVISTEGLAQQTALESLILTSDTICNLSEVSGLGIGSGIAVGTGFIYVPDALVDTYKITTNWTTYASQIKGISELP